MPSVYIKMGELSIADLLRITKGDHFRKKGPTVCFGILEV